MGVTVIGNTIYSIDGASQPGHSGSTNTLQTFVRDRGPSSPFRSSGTWTLGHFSPFPVQQLHAAVLNGSQIWLAGGLTGSTEADGQGNEQDGVLRHGAPQWSNGPPLPFAVHHAMMVTYRDQLWLIGGFLPSGPNLEAAASNKVLKLDATTGHWVAGPSLHHARAAGAAVVVGNKIVVVGGRTGGQHPGEVHADRDLQRQELARRRQHPGPG